MQLGRVEVIVGVDGGKYPHGNSVLVHGTDQRVLIDPSLSLVERGQRPEIDAMLLTHCHEDHLPGASLYPEVPISLHEADAPGLRSIDGLMAVYGMAPDITAAFATSVVTDYHYRPRPDAGELTDGSVIDAGGSTITAIHTPGHSRGHTAYLIEPEGVLVLGDIDLTGFGPYYGDAASCLDDFVVSIERVRAIEAAWYATFHHKGVYTDRVSYLEAVDAFAAMIDKRDAAMVDFLSEPRTIADMIEHRFVYRPHVDLPWVASAEERTARQHLDRLLDRGEVVEVGEGEFQAAPAAGS